MTIQELKTLYHFCELDRAQLPIILAMSVQNPQLLGYFSNGNCNNFLYIEVSTASFNDCPQFFSPMYESDKGFRRIPRYGYAY